MSITTVDGIVAGLLPSTPYQKASFTGEAAGQWATLMALAGNPGAAALGTPGLNGATVSQSTLGGALPYTNPSGSNLGYLAKMAMSVGANLTSFCLYDLLWYNTGITITTTTQQAITSVTFPSRCIPASGTTPDANGGGLECWLWASATTGNAGAIANTTFAYTNQAGTGSRSAGLVYSFPATGQAGTIVPFALQAGDTGIRSIQGITLGTSYVSGTVNMLVVRRIAEVYFPVSPAGAVYDFASLGLPRIYDSSALYGACLLSGTAAGNVAGSFNFAQG
jgi:hypothetical protein